METKAKLFVFSKMEVWMLFLFMVIIAITCFIFGVRIGKNYVVTSQGYSSADQAKVEMYSGQEEKVQEMTTGEETKTGPKTEELKDESFRKLKEKIDKEFTAEEKSYDTKKKTEPAAAIVEQATPSVETRATGDETISTGQEDSGRKYKIDAYSGKYTIQIASYQEIKDAQKFADGFVVRGYDPIINEAILPGRGTWYRVSLGVFETVGEAKDYIVKHKELFRGQDYVIEQFD